jgi:hypothetical protein
MSETGDNGVWEKGWREHDTQQLRRLAALPLVVKLKWLEEAHRIVRHLSRKRDGAAERRDVIHPTDIHNNPR